MKIPEYAQDLIPKNELVFDNFEDAVDVLRATTRNELNRTGDYCVLFSREEEFYVLSFLYSQRSDRNDVVFMPRDLFEMYYCLQGDDEDDNSVQSDYQ